MKPRLVPRSPRQNRGTVGAAMAFALSLWGACAVANPIDTYGFGSRAVAQGGAVTGRVEGALAPHYNPAGVARQLGARLHVGLSHQAPNIKVNDAADSDRSLSLWHVGVALPLPLGRWLSSRLALGAAAALPSDGIYKVRQADDRDVAFPLLGARNRRLAFAFALAWRITPRIRLGGGASLLPDVPGRVLVDLSDASGDTSTAIDIDYDWAPTAGLQIDLPLGLAAGLSYRAGHATDISLPVYVSVTETLPVTTRISGPAFSSPRRWLLGVAWTWEKHLQIGVDLGWYAFSDLNHDSPEVSVLDTDGQVTGEFTVTSPKLDDVLVPRVGIEWWPWPWLATRTGYEFHPTPVPAQRGVTNLLDGDRHVVSAGLGLRLPSLGDGAPERIDLDLHGQLHRLETIAWEKEEMLVGNPGYPTVRASGHVLSAGVAVTVTP